MVASVLLRSYRVSPYKLLLERIYTIRFSVKRGDDTKERLNRAIALIEQAEFLKEQFSCLRATEAVMRA